MDLKGKNVLVTGAGGFIGSHLVEALVNKGANVTAFVMYNSYGNWENIDDFPSKFRSEIRVIAGDIRDSDSVRRVCKGQDVIFHLGALISITYSYEDPRNTVDTNVIGTLNVMTAARDFGIKKIIHTSTSEVYGTAKYVPIDENHSLQAQSPYAASKIGADKIAESFHLSYDLPVVTVRPFNTYGPRQSARAVIPTIISQALTKDSIKIGSLDPKRDFTFVKDTADGFIKAAETDNITGEVINLGTGKHVSIGDLVNAVKRVMGKDFEVVTDSQRIRPAKSEVMELLSDNRKAKRLINWEPKYDLDEGIKETIEYIKANINKYKPEIYAV